MQAYRISCSNAASVPLENIIRAIQRGLKSNNTGLELKLSNSGLNETSINCLISALNEAPVRIEVLDMSFNKLVKDVSIKRLIGYIEKKSVDLYHQYQSCKFFAFTVKHLNLEKTSITDQSALVILRILPMTGLESLNLSSTKLSPLFFQNLIDLLEMTGNDINLKSLSLQNTKLSDQYGIQLFETVIERTKIEDLNLRQNQLGFKMGQAAIQVLKSVKKYVKLKRIGLEFNQMSDQMKHRVGHELSNRQEPELTEKRNPFKEIRNQNFKQRNVPPPVSSGRNSVELSSIKPKSTISHYDLREISKKRSNILYQGYKSRQKSHYIQQKTNGSSLYQPYQSSRKESSSSASNRSFLFQQQRKPSQIIVKKPQIISSQSFMSLPKHQSEQKHHKKKSSCDFDIMLKSGQFDEGLLQQLRKGCQHTERNQAHRNSQQAFQSVQGPTSGPFRFIVKGNLNNIQAYETSEFDPEQINPTQSDEIESIMKLPKPAQPEDNVSEVLTNYSIRPPSQNTDKKVEKMLEGGQIGELANYLRAEISRFQNILGRIEASKSPSRSYYSGQGNIEERPSGLLEHNLQILRTRLLDYSE